MKRVFVDLLIPLILGVALIAAGFFFFGSMSMTQAAPVAAQGPLPGTVQGVGMYTLFTTQQISNVGSATITYTNAPYMYKGLDMAMAKNWNGADAFVTLAGFGAGDELTVTAQLSPDETNWADAYYTYIGDASTSVTTSTMTPQTAYYRTIPTADGTTYFSFPIAGQYLRYKIAYSGTMTLTIKNAYRNN